jgi:glyoxylase-like metal-dependent hydrolase (beta-lactamase superfamily II)
MIERIIVGLMYTNAYIFQTGQKTCLIVDPGADTEKIISSLTLKNLKPQGIICTHGHLDHVSAIGGLTEHYREQGIDMQVAIHEDDKHYLGATAEKAHRDSLMELGLGGEEYFNALFSPLPEPSVFLKEGEHVFDSELIPIHTPGHTMGSVSLYCESQNLVFSGDTLFFEGIGRTDLNDGDGELLIKSIKEKLFTLPENTRIFPGHGPDTTLEREINHNPFLR